ncbi:MAG: hypothetical protein R3B72_51535 [Polyangiaceae bacterium]
MSPRSHPHPLTLGLVSFMALGLATSTALASPEATPVEPRAPSHCQDQEHERRATASPSDHGSGVCLDDEDDDDDDDGEEDDDVAPR